MSGRIDNPLQTSSGNISYSGVLIVPMVGLVWHENNALIKYTAHLLAVSNVPRARVLRVAQAQLVACTGGAMFFAKGEAWLSGRDFIARLDQWSAPAPLTATNGWFLSSLRGMSNCEERGVGRSIQCRGRGVSPLLILLQLGGRLLLDTLRAVADSPVDVASVLGVIARLAEDTAELGEHTMTWLNGIKKTSVLLSVAIVSRRLSQGKTDYATRFGASRYGRTTRRAPLRSIRSGPDQYPRSPSPLSIVSSGLSSKRVQYPRERERTRGARFWHQSWSVIASCLASITASFDEQKVALISRRLLPDYGTDNSGTYFTSLSDSFEVPRTHSGSHHFVPRLVLKRGRNMGSFILYINSAALQVGERCSELYINDQ
uniref:Uncharacterized protein n=1 Tax=Timema poppense TaxID=170557 RepID=A0A7R9H3E8_TIMPO|nr:unnamed protein product [Timema poppensis]